MFFALCLSNLLTGYKYFIEGIALLGILHTVAKV